MDADRPIAHESRPAQALAELARADERLKKALPSMTLLIVHGTADKATRPAGSPLFC
jgi:hypothetical protein